jgi:hypothetical protein
MTAGKRLVITVSPNGQHVQVDAQNFQGVGCKAATEAALKYVSGAQTDAQEKPEMYQTQTSTETVKAGCAS